MLVWSNRLLFSLRSVKIRGDKLPSLSNDVMYWQYYGNFEALKTSTAIEAVTISGGSITLLVRLFDLPELSTSLWFR